MSGRTQADRLQAIAERLSPRDHAIVRELARLRYVSTGQIARLHFAAIAVPATRTRRTQHQLTRLVGLGVLQRLHRRQGGVRAGSSGYTYTLRAEGQRLAALLDGRAIPSARRIDEPGSTFVAHALACSELYTQLIEAGRDNRVELLEYQAEPACWRGFHGLGGRTTLKPDGFVALGVGPLEYRSFLEIDRGSEGSSTLRRKLRVYAECWRSGAEQIEHAIFPRVVWLMDRPRRIELLNSLVGELPAEAQELFVAVLADDAVAALTGDTP